MSFVPRSMELQKRKNSTIALEGLEKYYTDIYAHAFDPLGNRVAAGTTFGRFAVYRRSPDSNISTLEVNYNLPESNQILCLHWAKEGIVYGGKNFLHFNIANNPNKLSYDYCKLENFTRNVHSSRCLDQGIIIAGFDDHNLRSYDLESMRFLNSMKLHNDCVEEITSSPEYIITGGLDGQIIVLDGALRTLQPVAKIRIDRRVTGLTINKNSVWLGVGTSNGIPEIFNLRSMKRLPNFYDTNSVSVSVHNKKFKKIYSVAFDNENDLWYGGKGGIVYKTHMLNKIDHVMKASYSGIKIQHVYAISCSANNEISVSGASSGILFMKKGEYWDSLIKF